MNQQQQNHLLRKECSPSYRPRKCIYWRQVFALDFTIVKTQQLFSLHGGFLNKIMQSITTEKQSSLINSLGRNKENDSSRIVRANEHLKLNYGGPSERQASGTNQQINALRLANKAHCRAT